MSELEGECVARISSVASFTCCVITRISSDASVTRFAR